MIHTAEKVGKQTSSDHVGRQGCKLVPPTWKRKFQVYLPIDLAIPLPGTPSMATLIKVHQVKHIDVFTEAFVFFFIRKNSFYIKPKGSSANRVLFK